MKTGHTEVLDPPSFFGDSPDRFDGVYMMLKRFFRAGAPVVAPSPREHLEALEHSLMVKRYSAMKLILVNADWAKRQVTRAMAESHALQFQITEQRALCERMDPRLAA